MFGWFKKQTPDPEAARLRAAHERNKQRARDEQAARQAACAHQNTVAGYYTDSVYCRDCKGSA